MRYAAFPITVTSTSGAGFAGDVTIPAAENPPVTVKQGSGWWVVVANLSAFWIVVGTPQGRKWIPPMVADVAGSDCDTCLLRLQYWDPIPPTGTVTHTGTLLLSWAFEPDSYGPDRATYPHAL